MKNAQKLSTELQRPWETPQTARESQMVTVDDTMNITRNRGFLETPPSRHFVISVNIWSSGTLGGSMSVSGSSAA